jgi:hypothetical protein
MAQAIGHDASSPPAWRTSLRATHSVRHGHIVLVVAKWMLVVAGLVLTLWAPSSVGDLKIQILALMLLAIQNFYYHAQIMRKRPIPDLVAYASSATDLAVITVLVAMGGDFSSNLFVFYYPALAAAALAFHQEAAALFATTAIALYAAISVAGIAGESVNDSDAQTLLVRLIVMAGIAFCGVAFTRIESSRRERAALIGVDVPVHRRPGISQ